MTDVFISYKQKDRESAHAIAEMLASNGYDVWWDINLLPGQKFADEINSIIQKVKAVVVLWTPESLESTWVKAETTLAMDRGILVPAWLKKVDLPAPYNTVHTFDLSDWNGESDAPLLEGLLKGVKDKVGKPISKKETRSKDEAKVILEKPKHEAEFWTAIAGNANQTIEEYKAYLEKYGDEAIFAELARLRIKKLENKKLSLTKIFTVGGIVVAMLVGLIQIADRFELLPDKEDSGSNQPEPSPLQPKSMLPGESEEEETDVLPPDIKLVPFVPLPDERSIEQEINFRIAKIDLKVEEAQKRFAECTNQIDATGGVMGSCVRDLYLSLLGLSTSYDFYGITADPNPESNAQYKDQNVGQLAVDYNQEIDQEAADKWMTSIKYISNFSKNNKGFVYDWNERQLAKGKYKELYGGAFTVYKVKMNDFKLQLSRIGKWLGSVILEWEGYKEVLNGCRTGSLKAKCPAPSYTVIRNRY